MKRWGLLLTVMGVLGGVLLAYAALSGWFFGVPVKHYVARLANDSIRSQDASESRLGAFLIKSGVAEDWQQGKLAQKFPDITAWEGQGATTKAVFQWPEFDGRRPLVSEFGRFTPRWPDQVEKINDERSFYRAVRNARPGDVLQLQPGAYVLKGRSIGINSAGRTDAPIIVRAEKLGTVTMKLDMLEGFHIRAPFWVFENLDIQGVCPDDSRCEHAFHVFMGGAFILRNNRIVDFNAPIKVNGFGPQSNRVYPDYGLLQNNVFANRRTRNTDKPVTMIDIVAANHWTVRGNLIADFAKGKGNLISYGAFMKGGGSDGVFENNVVICEMNLPPDRGLRIGLSFGGGGTSNSACRAQQCATEFKNGVMRNNVIINCSRDVGVYLNRATNTRFHNNLLHRTLGVDVRFRTSSAVIYNNIISGRVKLRNQGKAVLSSNRVDAHCFRPDQGLVGCQHSQWFVNLDGLDLTLKDGRQFLGAGVQDTDYKKDFCGNTPLSDNVDLGPIQYSANSQCNPGLMRTTIH